MPRKREPSGTSFIALEDNSELSTSAAEFFHIDKRAADPISASAKLAEQLIKQNRSIFSMAGIDCTSEFNGRQVSLHLKTGNTIGALPLISPVTGRSDYGLIVKPRFPWDGIGAMLGRMGWRVAPTALKLNNFRGSERSIPPWVLSSLILFRIDKLLKSTGRKFDVVTELRSAPRGQVRWNEYATRSMPTGNFSAVPCTFPDLRHDRELRGAIRYCLERINEALQTQIEHGAFVYRLIELAQQLLLQVSDVPAVIPPPSQVEAWLRKPLKTEFYVDGLQALQWTIEKRGLAGASNLEGIPWVMHMEAFFEAWLETVCHSIARRTGALFKVGRLRQTTRPISWDPPYMGSQKSLVPDLWLQWSSTTLIVDAKYKRHFEEFQAHNWESIEAGWKEQHRNDLLQVLAYANLAETRTIVSCLVYPCTPATWSYLAQAGKLFHKAELAMGERALHLWMTAAPMKATVHEVAGPIVQEVMPLVRAGE